MIANIPLCPFNRSTGSTEFWLGSHASTSGQQQVIATPESTLSNAKLRVGEPTCNVLPEVVEARRQVRAPIQPSCEKGDIMLRDLRTWHAGMPNESENYRIMLALGYQVSQFTPLSHACSMQFFLLGHRTSATTNEQLAEASDVGTVVSQPHSSLQSSPQPRKLLHEARCQACRGQSRLAPRLQ